MKKLMIAAAAMMAGVAMADVESANVVGYTTLRIESKYQIIGVQFDSVGGGALKLNDDIPYQEGMTKGNNTGSADQIQIGNDHGGWEVFYMSNGKNGKGKDVAGLDGKWSKNDGKFTVATNEIPAGTSFWYVRNNKDLPAFDLTIAGSVCTLPSASYTMASQYRIFCNPFAAPLPLNGGSFPYDETTMTAGNSTGTADQIQIGNDHGGWEVFYMSNGKNGKGKDVAGLAGKWSQNDGKFTVATNAIPVGKAAWYVRKDTSKPPVTFTFVKPYDL